MMKLHCLTVILSIFPSIYFQYTIAETTPFNDQSRWRLDGKTALVTGGTKGIGAAIVEDLANLGAKVYTCARSAEDLADCINAWRSNGLDVVGSTCDVSDEEQRCKLIADVGSVFDGKLDILINNVGTNRRKPTVEYTSDDFDFVMTTNLKSLYHISQLAHPLLKASGNGSIVQISSVVGVMPTKSGTIYSMTKAAMNQLTGNLACEWAPDNIRVNAIAPWYTATPLAMQVLKNPEFRKGVLSHTPLRRVAEVDEVSSAVAFLCMPGASYITGQVICVDGGYSKMGYYN
mmetsp:Transcript_8452/g.11170  ORF Transcript_8452/g.11170 Transcript_8452/m.11170 type:complete len:289 (-) Transcript_8452:194-1060(-)